MLISFQIPVTTQTGRRYPAAMVDVVGTRAGVSVQVYTNASRRIALRVTSLLRFDVRSAAYDSDPTPAVDFLINLVLDELASRRVRATRRPVTRWPAVKFDQPKAARWAGWTNRARRTAARYAATWDSPPAVAG